MCLATKIIFALDTGTVNDLFWAEKQSVGWNLAWFMFVVVIGRNSPTIVASSLQESADGSGVCDRARLLRCLHLWLWFQM